MIGQCCETAAPRNTDNVWAVYNYEKHANADGSNEAWHQKSTEKYLLYFIDSTNRCHLAEQDSLPQAQRPPLRTRSGMCEISCRNVLSAGARLLDGK
ncbi:hypothetical protein SKAU_G00384900 [Synaphobranchus kaupii]|uniref:Uncharacterized protein n=1 Tax=Synaphobranchus kaupii TaxID=118154 RepID=A0A9Q1EEG7_SYNKA|nr:hypothetical protein SKAU_G00384900 [Synaphobranchus kaupii]